MNAQLQLLTLHLLSKSATADPRTARNDPASLLLALLLASSSNGGHGGPKKPDTPERRKRRAKRAMLLTDFCEQEYFPAKRKRPLSIGSRENSLLALRRLRDCFAKDLTLREAVDPGTQTRFYDHLTSLVAGGSISAATANNNLRHLRAILGHAGKKKWATPPALELLVEEEHEVDAWDEVTLRRIRERAAGLSGSICLPTGAGRILPLEIPAGTWWAAWAGALCSTGARITATMLARREDFTEDALLLRAENQKQRKNQRFALPKGVSAAMRKLLKAHREPLIFPWPFDPPDSNGLRKWRSLRRHFRQLLLAPLGIKLPKGVATKQFRRTAATIIDEKGGNATAQLGHSGEAVTRRYKDRKRMPVIRDGLLIDSDPQPQGFLF